MSSASCRGGEVGVQLMLRGLARRRFRRGRFTGADALVARLPDSEPVSAVVQAKIDEDPPFRIYPVDGGT